MLLKPSPVSDKTVHAVIDYLRVRVLDCGGCCGTGWFPQRFSSNSDELKQAICPFCARPRELLGMIAEDIGIASPIFNSCRRTIYPQTNAPEK